MRTIPPSRRSASPRVPRRALILVLGFLLLSSAARPGLTASAANGGRRTQAPVNLLLVTLDTTRADHLGCYGYAKASTPQLDRLAAEGARADAAIAVAPLTLPSHCSLLAGVDPPRHGVHDNADYRLPWTQPTLATHLKSRGYATGAVVGSVVLAGALGLSRGFDTYDEPSRTTPSSEAAAGDAGGRGAEASPRGGPSPGPRDGARAEPGAAVSYTQILERRASVVTDAALRIVGRFSRTRPFFLWVHYYDPHADYDPPSPWRERFAQSLYDGEIAYTDAQLGRLLDALRKDGRLDGTLVAVVADHGESLGEHGEPTHGLFVYDSTLRVPLILRLPGAIPPRTRIEDVVSGADLAPTLLELMGQPPLPSAEGLSFAAAARGRKAPERSRRAVYSESLLAARAYGWSPLFSLRDADTRFIDAPDAELYDERSDPGESRNLASGSPPAVREWREKLLRAWKASALEGTDARFPMTPEERERLASLGYLSGSSPPDEGAGGARPEDPRPAGAFGGSVLSDSFRVHADPKSRLRLHVALLDIKKLISSGDREEARRRLGPVLTADPENPAALSLQGLLDFSAGKRDEGLDRLRDGARRAPGVYENQANLANALHAAGRLPEAAAAWQAALALRPAEASGRYALGNVLFAQQDTAGALKEYEEAVRLGGVAPGLLAALGVARLETGNAAGAREALRRAVASDPALRGAWTALGKACARDARWSEALTAYERSLALSPQDPDALFGRALVRLEQGRRTLAQEDARRLGESHPAYPALPYLRGRLLLASGDAAGGRRELTTYLGQARGLDPRLADSARSLLRDLDARTPAGRPPRR